MPYLGRRARLRFFDKSTADSLTRTVKIFGQSVTLDVRDLEQKYLAADCVREPENLLVYRALARSGLVDTFIDVGANCGHVAASIVKDYAHIVLFEPNPKLAALLRQLFGTRPAIMIRECAIVDEASVGHLTLTVPDDSSGLATLGGTHLSKQHDRVHTYSVAASTLAAETEELSLKTAYVKVDVEGFEANIIKSAKELIDRQRPIVGYEALSNEAAMACARLFDRYVFYCARFDFLESGGALSRSLPGMLKALVFGAHIEVLKFGTIDECALTNFSQIFSVPVERVGGFEKAITDFAGSVGVVDLYKLRTWS